MILPGKVEGMRGVIGTTFDAIFLVYPSEYAKYKWPTDAKEALWKVTKQYEQEQISIGSDGKAYVAELASVGINPVGDVSGHWKKLIPFNLEGSSAEAKIDGAPAQILLKVGSGVTMGGVAGTVAIKATNVQTAAIVPAKHHLAALITDSSGDLYEYVKTEVKWEAQ